MKGNQQISLSSLLIVASMAIYGATVEVDSPGLTINVSRSALHTSDTKCLVIQCNFDSVQTDIKTVTHLGMYGPKPYGQKADLVLFLEVYDVSKTPTVGDELKGIQVGVFGGINLYQSRNSLLVLFWEADYNFCPKFYECVANGITYDGKEKKVRKTVEILNGGACCESQSELGDLTTTNTLAAAVAKQRLDLSKKILELKAKMETELISTRTAVSVLSSIDKSKYAVSRVFRESVYLVHRQLVNFKLKSRNNDCEKEGGYLLELDDDDEFQFVFNFTRFFGKISMMTGGNDLEDEGVFTYVHSKKRVPQLEWMLNQKSANNGWRDCMAFESASQSLKYLSCVAKNVTYVCEVPFIV